MYIVHGTWIPEPHGEYVHAGAFYIWVEIERADFSGSSRVAGVPRASDGPAVSGTTPSPDARRATLTDLTNGCAATITLTHVAGALITGPSQIPPSALLTEQAVRHDRTPVL